MKFPGRVFIASLVLLLTAGELFAAAPILYSNPAYQSPVRGEPDELLTLAGYGFSKKDIVVYRMLSRDTDALSQPSDVPEMSNANEGVASVVSSASAPYSIVVKLPAAMKSGQPYGLWVRNTNDEWSNGVRINDARPLWFSPALAFETERIASLPRYLKVIGRNLEPIGGQHTRVRLSGPGNYVLNAESTSPDTSSIDRYVARVTLPARMARGDYRVEISRDGATWVEIDGPAFVVKADSPAALEFRVDASSYGDCAPDDDRDDTECIARAIAAAARVGGVVVFGPGRWNLVNANPLFVARGDGILVPPGVSLRGAGSGVTRIVRGASWQSGSSNSTFSLLGNNVVQGMAFEDLRRYGPTDAPVGMLLLGKAYYRADNPSVGELPRVADVVIADNRFDRVHRAIMSGGLPVTRLFVVNNDIGAYSVGLAPSGDRNYLRQRFQIEDSVVTGNRFRPGSYLDVGIGQGAMASTVGAAHRLDFSENRADGAATDALYSPENDARGWRAAFFWHMNNNHELMLVSRNEATCTGDKAGDGEAIAYDNNANTFGFARAAEIVRATQDSVTVKEPLIRRQNNHDVDVASFYADHWVHIVEGRGVAQARHISSYSIDSRTSEITFRVAPAWDVAPAAGSGRITVQREFWQVYTLDNFVDQREPLCTKGNRNSPEGGKIAVWAPTFDSVVDGNRQYDTDGIVLHEQYTAEEPTACSTCVAGHTMQAFVEVRGNRIDGEYDWKSGCSNSGIQLSHGASPTPASPPPVLGFGISIVGNTISHADGLRGGGISFPLTWHAGPWPGGWKMIEGAIVQHNEIRDMPGPSSMACAGAAATRAGIAIDDPQVSGAVLYRNSCTDVTRTLLDKGSGTVRACPSDSSGSCECR